MSKNVPILDAYTDGRDVYVWCDHELCWHYHGVARDGSYGGGHKVAHCTCPSSPYKITGYILREAGRLSTKEILGKHKPDKNHHYWTCERGTVGKHRSGRRDGCPTCRA